MGASLEEWVVGRGAVRSELISGRNSLYLARHAIPKSGRSRVPLRPRRLPEGDWSTGSGREGPLLLDRLPTVAAV